MKSTAPEHGFRPRPGRISTVYQTDKNMNALHHECRYVEPSLGSTTNKQLTPAGAWLVRHRRVPRDLAHLIAELAGLCEARHG